MSTPPVNAPALVLDDDPRLVDTGWVDVAWLSTTGGLVITSQQARRAGVLVAFRLTADITATGTNVGYAAAAVTTGWRPPAAFAVSLESYNTGARLGALCLNAGGTVTIRAASTGTVNLHTSWTTA